MWQMIKHFIIAWLKTQFHGNPLVENTSEYLGKTVSALQVGLIGVISVISFAFVGFFIFIVGVIKGWY